MKKLYYLDESEKERILNLHENRTKEQYLLKENEDDGGDNTQTVEPLSPGTWTREAKDEFMTIVNSYTTSEYAGYSIRPTVAKIKTYCDTTTPDEIGPPSLSPEKIKRISLNHESFMKSNSTSQYLGLYQRGMTDASQLPGLISSFQNIPNLCSSIKAFKALRGSETVADIYDEVYSDNNFKRYVIEPLRQIGEATKIYVTKAQREKQNQAGKAITDWASGIYKNIVGLFTKVDPKWKKYPCVVKGGGKPVSVGGNDTDFLKIVGDDGVAKIYRNDGKYYISGKQKEGYKSYKCNNKTGNIIDVESGEEETPPADKKSNIGGSGLGTYVVVAGGYVNTSVFTPQVLQAIRNKIGSKDTATTLTQNDINLIYQKLGG